MIASYRYSQSQSQSQSSATDTDTDTGADTDTAPATDTDTSRDADVRATDAARHLSSVSRASDLPDTVAPPPFSLRCPLPLQTHVQRRLFVNRQISRAFRVDLHFVLSERRFIIIFFLFSFFYSYFFLLFLFVLVGFFGVFGAAQFAFWATEVDKFFNL